MTELSQFQILEVEFQGSDDFDMDIFKEKKGDKKLIDYEKLRNHIQIVQTYKPPTGVK